MAEKAKRDELVFLQDILDCIGKIEQYVEGLSEVEFEQNLEKQDAVIRRIEVMGEAVKNLSSDTRQKYPEIPWRSFAGMRDILIHQYFGVTLETVWQAATVEIPDLKDRIIQILKEVEQKPT